MSRKINAREIIADLGSGMEASELISKYNLSLGAFKRVLRQVNEERKARARAIAEDLKRGLSELEVIRNHQLTGEGFRRIIEILVDEQFISQTEIESRAIGKRDFLILDLRKGPRYQPKLSVLVCDRGYTHKTYELLDISEYGLAVKGMNMEVGEVTPITVLGDDYGQVVPFEFQAQCRWTRKDPTDGQPLCGFEITSISVEDLGLLCGFIARFALPREQGRPD